MLGEEPTRCRSCYLFIDWRFKFLAAPLAKRRLAVSASVLAAPTMVCGLHEMLAPATMYYDGSNQELVFNYMSANTEKARIGMASSELMDDT